MSAEQLQVVISACPGSATGTPEDAQDCVRLTFKWPQWRRVLPATAASFAHMYLSGDLARAVQQEPFSGQPANQ